MRSRHNETRPQLALQVNGEVRALPHGANVRELLVQLHIESPRVAVAVNREVVPPSRWDVRELQEGDRVEILEAVGGG